MGKVAVIGGGATGTAAARDLRMRGFDVVLFERGSICGGASGKSHNNLLSGMRYVLTDSVVAVRCNRENKIMSRIAQGIVGKAGNYFVGLNGDYCDKALARAKSLGIDFAEVENPDIPITLNNHCVIETEDKNIDVKKLCELCSKDVEVRKEEVTGVNGNIVTTKIDRYKFEMIINAAGPWAGKIARLAGYDAPVKCSGGAIAVLDLKLKRGVQKLDLPGNGGALIPRGDYALLGTTSFNVVDPDKKINLSSETGTYLKDCFAPIMDLSDVSILGVFYGIRPLISPMSGEQWISNMLLTDGRQITRGFSLIDHGEMVTIVGGKITTARLMAEEVSNLVCNKLGVRAECRTHLEELT